jgi:parallel beta-helix repeat protein
LRFISDYQRVVRPPNPDKHKLLFLAEQPEKAMRAYLLLGAVLALPFFTSQAKASEAPGPSAVLYNHPYYACVKNYYVAKTGSDTNSGTSETAPWATLQHANDSLPGGGAAAGSCINVAPGTYNGVELTNGGNYAASTGYVTYRCKVLLGCTVRGNAGVHNAEAFETRWNTNGTPPNYLMIDGFKMIGYNSSANGVGVSAWNGDNGSGVASHHIWVINNRISGFGQSGIGIAAGEYYYLIHNGVFLNSNLQCYSQGSGIAINIMHSVPNYVPTADDMTNPNPLLGPTWAVGSSFFHNVVEYNNVNNNAITQCGAPSHPTNTDGNGIIFDSNLTGNGDTEDYGSPSLVAFNVVYNNGGGGVHLFFSADVTVANNTCYNSQLDPGNGGTSRACLDDSNGYADTFINNIAVAIPVGYASGTCWNNQPPYTRYNFAILGAPAPGKPLDTFSNNITQVLGQTCSAENSMFNGDTYSCSANRCGTEPKMTSVGSISTGSMTKLPTYTNFALQAGSPAIGYGLAESYLPASSVDAGACGRDRLDCW